MARHYDQQIINLVQASPRPLGHRDLYNQIGGEYAVFGSIGTSLTLLYREGQLRRTKIDGHWHYYTSSNGHAEEKTPDRIIVADIGATIRSLREQALLSIEDLAARSGFAVASIRDIERGHVRPSLYTVELLLAALGYKAELTITRGDRP